MSDFATIEDMSKIWRPINPQEMERATELLRIVSDSLRYEATKVGKDLDKMIEEESSLSSITKSVTVDVVARTLMTSTNTEPVTQVSQSALGYSMSASYLVPGGGLFIKRSELSRLGLKRQKIGVIELYGDD